MSTYKYLPVGFNLSSEVTNFFSALSPRWVKPGSLFGPSLPTVLARGFEGGSPFIPQNSIRYNERGEPLNNICGTMSYRQMVTHIDDAYDERRVLDYVFRTIPESTVGDVTTPASYSVFIETTGAVIGGPGNSGDSPSRGTYYNEESDGTFKVVGFRERSLEVTESYLTSKLTTWFGESRAFREATQYGYYWGKPCAAVSASQSGWTAYVSGMKVSSKDDLTPDIMESPPNETRVAQHGFSESYSGKVVLVRRRNFPWVFDLGGGPETSLPGSQEDYGLSVYRSGEQGEELTQPITEKKWRDAYGTYNRRSEPAFEAVGYTLGDLYNLLPLPPATASDITAEIGFVSKDGVTTYRVTLEAGAESWNEGTETYEFNPYQTDLIVVTPQAMAKHSYDSFIASATMVKVTKLEGKIGDATYEELPIDNALSYYPTPTCKVLMVVKRRSGQRWGHQPFIASEEELTDYEDAPRYLKKTLFVKRSAVSATP